MSLLPVPLWMLPLVYSVLWVGFHFGGGYLAHRAPERMLDPEGPLFRIRDWERGGEIYQRLFRIRAWKGRIPEAGAFYRGGISKRRIGDASPEKLRLFIRETCRAELSHWIVFAAAPTFFFWNAPVVGFVMAGYGLLANVPFIAVQRFNRPRLQRLLTSAEGRRRASG